MKGFSVGIVNRKLRSKAVGAGMILLLLFLSFAPHVGAVEAGYHITYDGNSSTGGSVPVDSGAYANGDNATVLDVGTLVRGPYTFAGWNTQSNGTGTTYAPGASMNIGDGDVTLYARWLGEEYFYHIVYDGNGSTGGSAPEDSNSYIGGSIVTPVLDNTGSLVKTGYEFAGWSYSDGETITNYAAGSMLSITRPTSGHLSDITLEARWTPILTVTYDGNGSAGGGVPAESGASYAQGVTVTVYGNTGSLEKTGYTFADWNTQADGKGIGYVAGDTFAMGESNVTLYAKWAAIPTYTVTYDGNGNTGGGVPAESGATYTQGETVTVYGNTGSLEKTDYTFAGWNTQADGKGTGYAADGTFAMGETNVTLYAAWTLSSHDEPPTPVKTPTPAPASTPAPDIKLVLESNPDQEGESAKTGITQIVGTGLTLSARLMTLDGKELHIPDIPINIKGEFSIANVPPGQYRVALSVVAPTGEKLAGRVGKLTVNSDGSARLESDLIDPNGMITNAVTGEKIDGAKVTLHWADTALNHSNGRIPGELVVLPELPDFAPNQNHDPQSSKDGGQYGWMVFPDSDYYILAEKDGYETFDSRQDTRDEMQGEDSFVKDGNIHVGMSIVKYDFEMQPVVLSSGKHMPYMLGYPDGSFRPERGISRAEVAAILSRLFASNGSAAATASFPDVASTHWAAQEIKLAAQQHWMVGYGNGNFEPERKVTRAELAQVIQNVKQWAPATTSSFTDIGGHWAEAAIAALEQHDLLDGYPNGMFQPDQAITRVEADKIFNQLTGRDSRLINITPKWTDVPQSFWGYDIVMEASIPHTYSKYEGGWEAWERE